MKKVGVSILGLGVVGGGAYQILTQNREFYRETQNVDIVVESVLEPNEERLRALGVPAECVAHNIAEVALDPDVNIVVECIGGAEAAKEYVLDALNAGKTVVTSNKELYAKYSHELERAAKHHNAGLFFEAACLGGIPVVRTLLDGLQSNRICTLAYVVNGTANDILTAMTEKRVSYEEALAAAGAHGASSADGAEGDAAAYKLSILASLAFHAKVPDSKVVREGAEGISAEDVAGGDALGYALKLLAVAKHTSAGCEVRIHPAFVRKDHPLAAAKGDYSAVLVRGDAVGDVVLYGKSAGALPSGSAVVSDILYAATHSELHDSTFRNTAEAGKEAEFVSDFRSAYFLRLTADDAQGVLSKIAAVFGKNNISLAEVAQRPAKEAGKSTVLLVTHETHEEALFCAAEKLAAAGLAKVESVLRVA